MPECHPASLYAHYFGLSREPFSISPDPRYLFMSPRHHEALAHLLYGATAGGGVVLLSGEIGTGKTTICRCLLERLPQECEVAYIFNPKLTVPELLQAICEEFRIPLGARDAPGAKDYIDALNRHLLARHAEGGRSVLIIDEAQNLSIDVLEQLRLLTNLETSEHKLLQVILIGQPELRDMLARPELEQLAQRVVARYHLQALSLQETASYIQHRLATAGLAAPSPIQQPLMRRIHQLTNGVPRRINLLCDRALLGAYTSERRQVDRATLDQAAAELFDLGRHGRPRWRRRVAPAALAGIALVAGAAGWISQHGGLSPVRQPVAARAAAVPAAHAEARPAATPAVAPAAVRPTPVAAIPAAAADARPEALFSEQDGQPAAALRSKADALRELASAWGATAAEGKPCEAVRQAGLRCYDSNGGIGDLRRLDRPAVLTLHAANGTPYYAILEGLDDVTATLRAGDKRQVVSLVLLSRYFSGEFSTLWRLPSAYGEVVTLNDEGTEVDWIAAQLAKAAHGAAPAPGIRFDQAMRTQVREFQRAQGLQPDGVVGPVTFMQINRVAGIAEPRLRHRSAALAEAATPGV